MVRDRLVERGYSDGGEVGAVCEHCGGKVGEDGYTMDLGQEEEFSNFEDPDDTDQQKATVRMREGSGFAEAMKRRRGDR